jgi:hypothetical protein
VRLLSVALFRAEDGRVQTCMTAARSRTVAAVAENPLAHLTFGLGRGGLALIESLGLALGAVGSHRAMGILGDEVDVDGPPGAGARIGGTDDPRDEIGHVPGDPDPGNGGETGRVGVDVLAHAEGMDGRLKAKAGEHLGAGHEARHERHGPARDDLAVAHLDAREAILDDLERRETSPSTTVMLRAASCSASASVG